MDVGYSSPNTEQRNVEFRRCCLTSKFIIHLFIIHYSLFLFLQKKGPSHRKAFFSKLFFLFSLAARHLALLGGSFFLECADLGFLVRSAGLIVLGHAHIGIAQLVIDGCNFILALGGLECRFCKLGSFFVLNLAVIDHRQLVVGIRIGGIVLQYLLISLDGIG